jgi:iron complex outermembrane recepter protein
MKPTNLRRASLAAGVSLALGVYAAPVVHAAGAIEEVVVTGSYIRGTPEDAALPVDVLTRQDLEDLGNPSIIEMVRNLGITSGNLGETNQFQTGGQGNEGVSTINLRGLGGARTLVLLNGRRHVATETQGVDIGALPVSAVGRIEILKDGAAALYGSDAIAGVVNMITRSGFEGVEVRGSNQFIEDSDGDQDVSVLYGWANDTMNWMVAGEYQRRGELMIKDRDWALLPRSENPNGGWSGISNPARFIAQNFLSSAPDPRCDDLGTESFVADAAGNISCSFQFTFFDNLIEEQDTYKLYSEYNWTISDAAELHVEALYSKMDMSEWKTSPSYPPQSLFGPDRLVAASHPGLQLLRQQYPSIPLGTGGVYGVSRMLGAAGLEGDPQEGTRETETYRLAASLKGALFNEALNYDFGLSWSSRERSLSGYDMYVERMAFAIDGLGGPNCDRNAGTPGVGDCLYYNPFSNAIQKSAVNGFVNPDFPAGGTFNGFRIDNPRELLDWLVGEQESTTKNDLLVWDLVLSGETPWALDGGNIGWAAGFQARNEKFDFDPNDLTDLTVSPCAFNDPRSVSLGNISQANFDRCLNNPTIGTGPLAFLAGANPNNTSRNVYGIFGELAVPISDTIDMQLAIRYEDYGGNVGNTIDPKVAVRWQANDWLAVRGSASSTFRGPPQSFLNARGTSLQFVTPANAFKAVDTFGNPNLGPEEATAINLGVIVDYGNFYGSVDFWQFDFSDPFQVESPGQLVTAYQIYGIAPATLTDGSPLPVRPPTQPQLVAGQPMSCEEYRNPLFGSPTPECIVAASHIIFPQGSTVNGGAAFNTVASLERIEANYLNGGDQKTNGVDVFAEYQFDDVMSGVLSLGVEGTYTFEFDVDDFTEINGLVLAPGGDFMGYLNTAFAPLTPKPELKGRLFAKYNLNGHNITAVMNYVDEYKDARGEVNQSAVGTPVNPSILTKLTDIDSMVTYDLHWNWTLMNDSLVLSLSGMNLTDEDPPMVALDQNYDPFTHNAFGRMIKAGVKYTFGAQ